MPLFYMCGERVEKGDRVLHHGEQGIVEFVADPEVDPDDWYVKEYGGGVMVWEPELSIRTFLHVPIRDRSDLEFLCRGDCFE